jgi:hypothetical protein
MREHQLSLFILLSASYLVILANLFVILKDAVNSEKLPETAKGLKPRAIFSKGATNVAADQVLKFI